MLTSNAVDVDEGKAAAFTPITYKAESKEVVSTKASTGKEGSNSSFLD